MDEFVGFNYLLLDVAGGTSPHRPGIAEQCHRRERVDVIARQFRDFLKQHEIADEHPRGTVMTHDFEVRGQATRGAGWLSFHVDRGGGEAKELERVALVAFSRDADGGVAGLLRREAPGLAERQLPASPFAVGVLLVAAVPSVVSEFLPKAAAGFFSDEF